MSGTLGTAPIREIGVVGVSRLVAAVRNRFRIIGRRGGLAVRVAVPVAVVVTAALVWATVTAASTWVSL
jgi:hypothetical protein